MLLKPDLYELVKRERMSSHSPLSRSGPRVLPHMRVIQALVVQKGHLHMRPEGGSIQASPGLLQVVLCAGPAPTCEFDTQMRVQGTASKKERIVKVCIACCLSNMVLF